MASKRHQHRFERLSDVAIFCACGEVRQVPQPHVCDHWCGHTYIYPTRIYPTWTVSSLSDTSVNGNAITLSSGNSSGVVD